MLENEKKKSCNHFFKFFSIIYIFYVDRCEYCLNRHTSPPEDPYQMLQDLLNKGCLIKEAVKRLQMSQLSQRCEPREDSFISPQTNTSINLY